MDRIKLTENFYLDEFTLSETAERHGIPIVVEPNSEIFLNIKRLCETVLQPLRDALGPVTVLSGFRPPSVNKIIGGATTSFHVWGLAADIIVAGYTPQQVCEWIRNNIPGFDQLIHEYGRWTHVGIAKDKQVPRVQLLTAVSVTRGQYKKTAYVAGILPIDEALRRAA